MKQMYTVEKRRLKPRKLLKIASQANGDHPPSFHYSVLPQKSDRFTQKNSPSIKPKKTSITLINQHNLNENKTNVV